MLPVDLHQGSGRRMDIVWRCLDQSSCCLWDHGFLFLGRGFENPVSAMWWRDSAHFFQKQSI